MQMCRNLYALGKPNHRILLVFHPVLPFVFVLQLNVYLNRKFPGKSLSDGGDGGVDAGDSNNPAEEATKVSTADNDEPPGPDTVDSQYPVTSATDGFNLGFDTGDNATTTGEANRSFSLACPLGSLVRSLSCIVSTQKVDIVCITA